MKYNVSKLKDIINYKSRFKWYMYISPTSRQQERDTCSNRKWTIVSEYCVTDIKASLHTNIQYIDIYWINMILY